MQNKLYTVTGLNHSVKDLLESEFVDITVEGEISNFSCPASGHWYFSLKDKQSQIRCAMFRNANIRVNIKPDDGLLIQATGRVSLYAPRGDYQLIINQMHTVGDGDLQRLFEQLKNKLNAEGLFDLQFKKAIPSVVNAIGVVTSSTGAALHDIIHVLRRRNPHIEVIIYPSLVQGDTAAANIVRMIELADKRKECDVLIIGRGGGSLEDLWSFNDERVARAVFSANIPIISAVGHEVDVTISDFVADLRAPTPSAAAELVSTEISQRLNQLQSTKKHLQKSISLQLQGKYQHIEWLNKRLRHPKQRLNDDIQRLDRVTSRLYAAVTSTLERCKQQCSTLERNLNLLSPLSTLKRGYTIVSDKSTIIKNAADTTSKQRIDILFHDGNITATIE